jgi:acyl transferase domain-containing protein
MMMEPAVEPFAALVSKATPQAPKIRFVSSVSGTWITEAEATDPQYWARQMRLPVRFGPSLRTLMEKPERILLEVGPRGTSSVMARQVAEDGRRRVAIASLDDNAEKDAEWTALLRAVGQLWLSGVNLDWEAFHAGCRRKILSLPSYPFERQRYWIDPPTAPQAAVAVEGVIARQMEILSMQLRILRGESEIPHGNQ